MAAKIGTIWSNLMTALASIDGSGSYTFDLSAAGQVGRIRRASPPTGIRPYVTCVFDEAPSSHDVVLGTYRRDVVFTIVGWGVASADTEQARSEAAVNLFDDILRAVESDRTLSGQVYEVICHGRSFVGSEPETGAQVPIAVVRVECYLRVDTGA